MIRIHLLEIMRLTPNFQSLSRAKLATDCLISLKFGTEFYHITAEKKLSYRIETTLQRGQFWHTKFTFKGPYPDNHLCTVR